jgi:NADH-quinone oxidoreductase subunit M
MIDGGTSDSTWIFLAFAFAFAIKAPLFPFHGWLPDAYREAPPEVAAVLSGVIAKAGLYGMLRIAIPKFPDATTFYRTAVLALAAAALVYGSLLAFRAADFRGVVAYSSLAQSGLIALGLFAGRDLGFDGAVLQMVAHGLVSISLFLIAGAVERRTTTGEFRLLGGMAKGRPALATLLMTVGVISLAVPGSSMFAGEFLILGGVFQRAWWWAAIGAVAIVLAAMYMLRLISAVLHEARGSTVSDSALDLRPGELSLIVPLVGLLLALSVWPAGISHHSFFGPSPAATVKGQFK